MRSSCAPLQPASANEHVTAELKQSEYQGTKSESTFHLFLNETDSEVELFWFYDGGQEKHGTIAPGSNAYIGTYTFHQWKVMGMTGQLLGVYTGASATITIRSNGCKIQVNGLPAGRLEPMEPGGDVLDTPEGTYRKRGEVLGMAMWAFDCVGEAAVSRLAHVTSRMLESSPDWVLRRLQEAGSALAIVGKEQVVTDLPPHHFMRHMQERNLDLTSRGLGATLNVPVTSVGEENLTMIDDETYPCQSILVHELGHAVLNLAFDQRLQRRLCKAFQDAQASGTYPACYMMSNEQEYFATGTEAWFESTIRTDVNGGVNTRATLQSKDPLLAELLATAFGDGSWRYTHDCPVALKMPGRRRKAADPPSTQTGTEDGASGTSPPAVVAAAASGDGGGDGPSAAAQRSSGAGADAEPAPCAAAASVSTPLLQTSDRGQDPSSSSSSSSRRSQTSAAALSPERRQEQQSSVAEDRNVGGSGRSLRWEVVGVPAACDAGEGDCAREWERPAKVPRLGWRYAWGLPGCSCVPCSSLEGLSGCLPCVRLSWGLLNEFKGSNSKLKE